MSPLVKALLMLLLEKGVSGGLGGMFGGGHPSEPQPSGGAGPYGRDPGPHPSDAGGRDTGDIGGFGQYRGHRTNRRPTRTRPMPAIRPCRPATFPISPACSAAAVTPHPVRPKEMFHMKSAGGLDGLVESFRKGGLGDVMQSWIGPGANHPVAPDQLAHALGPDTLDTLQSQTGMDRATLLSQLAQALPEVVHALTPQGRVPDVG